MYKAPFFLVLMTAAFSCAAHAPTNESSLEDKLVKTSNAASAKTLLENEFAKENGGQKPVIVYGVSGPTIFISAFQNTPDPVIDSFSDDIFVTTTNSNKPGGGGRKSTTPTPASTTESSGACVINNERGACVPYYACDADTSTTTSTHIDVQFNPKDIRCESYLVVCCPKTKVLDPKNTKSNGHTVLEDVFSKNNTASGHNVLEDVFIKNNTASGHDILDDVFSKNNTSSGHTVLEEVFSKNNTASGHSVLDDVFSKDNTSSGPNILEDVLSKNNTASGQNVLDNVFSKNSTGSGNTVLQDVFSKNSTGSGNTVLQEVFSKNNTSSGYNVLEDEFSKNYSGSGYVLSKNDTGSGHNVLDDVFNKNHTGDREAILEDIYINIGNRQKPVGSRDPTVAPTLPAFQNKPGPGSDSVLEELFGTTTNSNNTGGAGKKTNTTIAPAVTTEPNATCTTRKNEKGECVLYFLCDVDEQLHTTDQDEHITDWTDLPCESLLDVCCPKAQRIGLNSTTTTAKPAPALLSRPVNVLTRRTGDTSARLQRQASTVQPAESGLAGCGWRNTDGAVFAGAGDQEYTKFAEFPWIAAILKNETELAYIGSGSLIHPNVVLTAAHHVDASQKLRVRLGEWDTLTTNEIYPHQDREVAKVEVHKDFNKGNLFYDIALLFLATPVDPAPNIGVVCLPPPNQRAVAGTRCFSTGWGKDKFGKEPEGVNSAVLQKVDVPVVERKECLSALRKSRLGSIFELHSSFMCAGGETARDTCKLDGGSPLVCPIEREKNRYVQNGIVAWGIGCGGDGTPGVYVDVAKLREWIDDKVKGQGYDIFGYSYTV